MSPTEAKVTRNELLSGSGGSGSGCGGAATGATGSTGAGSAGGGGGSGGVAQPARDDILIANVAKAVLWREALCRGDELATIAAHNGITVNYLGAMLPFAFLSPKLVRAILQGRQPPALTTNWIRRHGLPASWAEQDRIIAQL